MKPEVKFSGANGNVFNLLGIASKALNKAGLRANAYDMRVRVFNSKSYHEAVSIMKEYVEVV